MHRTCLCVFPWNVKKIILDQFSRGITLIGSLLGPRPLSVVILDEGISLDILPNWAPSLLASGNNRTSCWQINPQNQTLTLSSDPRSPVMATFWCSGHSEWKPQSELNYTLWWRRGISSPEKVRWITGNVLPSNYLCTTFIRVQIPFQWWTYEQRSLFLD